MLMSKFKILIVEDDALVAKDIKQTLQNFGYFVTSIVTSGKQALVKAEKDTPDLVLMDIVLNGKMNGIETAHKIHNRFDIPVIYITAHSGEKTIEAAKEYRAKQVLLGGGVASNELLRQWLVKSSPIPVLLPEPILCTDNAAMIAACGYYRFQAGKIDGLDLDVIPSLKLA